MNYDFPIIKHIDDVLPHIANNPEFIVAERDGFTVIMYAVSGPDTFPPIKTAGGTARMRREREHAKAVLRECRGIVFDHTGKLLSRRLHKFFNANEREETQAFNIDLSRPHVILEKLDGSMITPLLIHGVTRWATKMGLSDVALDAEKFANARSNYAKFAEDMHAAGITPIFEFCSRKNRIVVDHPVDRMPLIAARHNETGEYLSYQWLCQNGTVYDIEVVKQYKGTVENMEWLVASIRDETEGEGWIIRFDDGHMVKMKNETYVRMHKTKDNIRFERHVVDLIINDQLDDVKGFLSDQDLKNVLKYEKSFWASLDERVAHYEQLIDKTVKTHRGDKKSFATSGTKMSDFEKAVVFNHWDSDRRGNVKEALLEKMKKTLFTNIKFDTEKHNFIPGVVWDPYHVEE